MLKQRQTAHSICTQLFRDGLIERDQNTCVYCQVFKLVSRLRTVIPSVGMVQLSIPSQPKEIPYHAQPWFWEGNVQASLAAWLVDNGYSIQSVANTATKEAGKDIIAVDSEGTELWITVKGYPNATERTNPSTQARHWFCGAIFDLVQYREERKDVALAAAFPDGFTTYRNLAERTTWLKEAAPFSLFWVAEDGHVKHQ
ncbi:hypothetical protein D3C72_175770 [compost metagenome]